MVKQSIVKKKSGALGAKLTAVGALLGILTLIYGWAVSFSLQINDALPNTDQQRVLYYLLFVVLATISAFLIVFGTSYFSTSKRTNGDALKASLLSILLAAVIFVLTTIIDLAGQLK